MDSFNSYGTVEDCLNVDWPSCSTVSNLDNGYQEESNVKISVVDSGAELQCRETNGYIKWRMSGGSQNDIGDGNSGNPPWIVTIKVLRPAQVTGMSAWVQISENDEVIQMPLQEQGLPMLNVIGNLVEQRYAISLQGILDTCSAMDLSVKLILSFGQLGLYEVCHFEIKELKIDIRVIGEDHENDNSIPIRWKVQKGNGPHRGRCQRLKRKDLNFLLKANISLENAKIRGFVRRVNDRAMIGKPKAVTGETGIPLDILRTSAQGANDPKALSYVSNITADLDPDQFYVDHPVKELYTSDKNTSENNIFIFGVRISVRNECFLKEVYKFQTRSNLESSKNKHQFISAMDLEATRADIKDLKIQKLTTSKGDIAYSWKLLHSDTKGRYEEGDVIGVFPNRHRSDEETYLDLLTPNNYREAILAGVITRSYYLAANCNEDDNEDPNEKICMVGKVPIKIFGPVKQGDFIYASNTLPGVGVSQDHFHSDKAHGIGREKRLLGYSLETNDKCKVKLVSCVVSILLSINNNQIEQVLARLEESLSDSLNNRMDEFRDDVDIQMNGMTQIVATTQDYVATKRRELSRRTRCVCSVIIFFFICGALSCYFFLTPGSPYIKWYCRRGSLPGSITFKIENRNDEKLVRMKGILFDVAELRQKVGVDFALKENFTGSYYLNLRKCKRENLRKVLGWFSNPPVYCRAHVFAASCDCRKIYHYHQFYAWKMYLPVFSPKCHGMKASQCNQTSVEERDHIGGWT